MPRSHKFSLGFHTSDLASGWSLLRLLHGSYRRISTEMKSKAAARELEPSPCVVVAAAIEDDDEGEFDFL